MYHTVLLLHLLAELQKKCFDLLTVADSHSEMHLSLCQSLAVLICFWLLWTLVLGIRLRYGEPYVFLWGHRLCQPEKSLKQLCSLSWGQTRLLMIPGLCLYCLKRTLEQSTPSRVTLEIGIQNVRSEVRFQRQLWKATWASSHLHPYIHSH